MGIISQLSERLLRVRRSYIYGIFVWDLKDFRHVVTILYLFHGAPPLCQTCCLPSSKTDRIFVCERGCFHQDSVFLKNELWTLKHVTIAVECQTNGVTLIEKLFVSSHGWASLEKEEVTGHHCPVNCEGHVRGHNEAL